MSKIAGLFGGHGALAAGALGIALAGGAGIYFKDVLLGAPEPEANQQAEQARVAEPSGEPAGMPVVTGKTVETAESAKPESASATDQQDSSATPEPRVAAPLPRFDTVRVEADGTTLVAGAAAPDAFVKILLGDELLGQAQAGGDGKFAAFVSVPASDEARMMRLESAAGESLRSVIIAPIVAQTAAAEPEVAEETGAGEEGAEAEPPAQEAPRAVLLAGADGVELLQAPNGGAPDVMSNVALDVISYSDIGDVALQGRAPAGGFVRVYLDNQPITTGRIAEDGRWRTELPDVDTGVYTLRVDEVSAEGVIQSRVETPFKREAPAALSAAQDGAAAEVRLVTVQPGATLWAIAKERFGEGRLYVQVYEANKDRIKDPDLIYPGQIFDLPN